MARYTATLTNEMTGEVAVLTSNDAFLLQNKITKKKESWTKQGRKLEQQEATLEATEEIDAYRSLLSETLTVDDTLDWESLKNTKSHERTQPILEDFFKVQGAAKLFKFVPMVKSRNEKEEAEAKKKLENALEEYVKDKDNFYKTQKEYNDGLKNKRKAYESGTKDGTQDYFGLVLERSKYPGSLTLNYEIVYEENSKVLLVEVDLPNTASVPKVVEYKYVASKDITEAKEMKPKDFEEYYNGVLYQIALRTLHEIFEADYSNCVEIAVFNGMVDGVNPKTGQDFHNCVLSLQVKREEFLAINLEKVKPRDCFRYLKGVSAGSLVNLEPVRPIMKLNTIDNRIVEANSVIDEIGDMNLATMDWVDFEVLVRDLIQKEFGGDGCKVAVTRASRDAGVDAIAFDEDPIRGGKFVIQAKRYNNLVPVSAVRDLYGTVVNEGAVKGILVTTSYYGPDAIDFAKSKPITLINGENLLHMFNKHGYKVKIELQKKQSAASNVMY